MSMTMELTLGMPTFQDSSPAPPSYLQALHDDHIMPDISKIKGYLKSLEEERRKIEAFKRELPLCMQLLSHEIEASRERLGDYKHGDTCASNDNPPRHHANSAAGLDMSPRFQDQIDNSPDEEVQVTSALPEKLYRTTRIGSFENDLQAGGHTLGDRSRGAFVPFLKETMRKSLEEGAERISPALHAHLQDGYPTTYSASKPGLTFSPVTEEEEEEEEAPNEDTYEPFASSSPLIHKGISSQPSPHRKPRRCWSAELHLQFVNALKQLGGSEVATPKQIRELMRVDGLTNDEVKSHLQKYRLHIKKPNMVKLPAQTTSNDTAESRKEGPQLVVLGGIWVPPDTYPLKQGDQMGHHLMCMNPVPYSLMDKAALTQQAGHPLFYLNHTRTQQLHASTH